MPAHSVSHHEYRVQKRYYKHGAERSAYYGSILFQGTQSSFNRPFGVGGAARFPLAFRHVIVRFQTEKQLTGFIQAVQEASPVDSFVTLEPWDMPGYDSKVIMAAGCFVSGASIELSADAPVKEPYTAYFQGGLTYEHCKCALRRILKRLQGKNR